jgi:hypothetical protein
MWIEEDLPHRCRGRHEQRNRSGRKILIEESTDALVVEDGRGRGQLDGELGGGCGEEGLVE